LSRNLTEKAVVTTNNNENRNNGGANAPSKTTERAIRNMTQNAAPDGSGTNNAAQSSSGRGKRARPRRPPPKLLEDYLVELHKDPLPLPLPVLDSVRYMSDESIIEMLEALKNYTKPAYEGSGESAPIRQSVTTDFSGERFPYAAPTPTTNLNPVTSFGRKDSSLGPGLNQVLQDAIEMETDEPRLSRNDSLGFAVSGNGSQTNQSVLPKIMGVHSPLNGEDRVPRKSQRRDSDDTLADLCSAVGLDVPGFQPEGGGAAETGLSRNNSLGLAITGNGSQTNEKPETTRFSNPLGGAPSTSAMPGTSEPFDVGRSLKSTRKSMNGDWRISYIQQRRFSDDTLADLCRAVGADVPGLPPKREAKPAESDKKTDGGGGNRRGCSRKGILSSFSAKNKNNGLSKKMRLFQNMMDAKLNREVTTALRDETPTMPWPKPPHSRVDLVDDSEDATDPVPKNVRANHDRRQEPLPKPRITLNSNNSSTRDAKRIDQVSPQQNILLNSSNLAGGGRYGRLSTTTINKGSFISSPDPLLQISITQKGSSVASSVASIGHNSLHSSLFSDVSADRSLSAQTSGQTVGGDNDGQFDDADDDT